jgi:hypothetical protein
MREGREHNLEADEIAALLGLADGREDRFRAVASDLDTFKKSVLDMAEDAGLIDAETRPAWDHADYIPFYRVREDDAVARPKGPWSRRGLSHQTSGIRRLRGGESAINDPLENLMRNFGHLVDAAMKNHAMQLVAGNLDGSEYLTEIPAMEFEKRIIPMGQVKTRLLDFGADPLVVDSLPEDALRGFAKMWAIKAPDRANVVRVMENGKARYFEVGDPALLRGLTAINQEAPGGVVKVMRAFKRVLTAGVTADPAFWARNAVRDALHAWSINQDGFKLGVDSMRGAIKAFREDGGLIDMLFSGASFQGGYLNANDPEAMSDSIRQALAAKGLLKRDADGYMKSVVLTAEDFWRRYRRIGDAIENASREAVFEAAGRSGKSRAERVFEAKDLMDYSMRGNWALIRFFGDVLPFFNARLQGLYKLGRSGSGTMLLRGGMIAAASLLLYAINKDRDDYDELEDWDKDSNWHFFFDTRGENGRVQTEHVRLPKPFEIGLLFGTVPERFARRMLGQDSAKESFQRLVWALQTTLQFDPIPQMLEPGAEVFANKDVFTGRTIENMADEGKLKSARYSENTSPVMRAIGAQVGDTISLGPKELEHLWRGYLGTIGAYALGAADMLYRASQGQPLVKESRPSQLPVVGSFWRTGMPPHTRFTTEFYDMLREAEQTYQTAFSYYKQGNKAASSELMQRERNKMQTRGILSGASGTMRLIDNRIDALRRDNSLSVKDRTAKIDALNAKRNAIAEKMVKKFGDRFQ